MSKLSLVITLLLCVQNTFAKCSGTSCLRAIIRNDPSGSFCSSYLSTPGLAIPESLHNCKDSSEKVSSACSCLGSPATSTAPIPATTQPSDPIAGTCTAITTITITALASTVTVSEIATTTAPSTCNTSPVPACIYVNVDGRAFRQLFAGSGIRTPIDNPASNGATPDFITYPASDFYNDCEAITACAIYMWRTGNNDGTIDMHFLKAENVWSCTGYYQYSGSSYFSIEDSNVGAAYGYSG